MRVLLSPNPDAHKFADLLYSIGIGSLGFTAGITSRKTYAVLLLQWTI